jgi:hypothetical protein
MGTKPPKRGENRKKKQNTLLVDGNPFKTLFSVLRMSTTKMVNT